MLLSPPSWGSEAARGSWMTVQWTVRPRAWPSRSETVAFSQENDGRSLNFKQLPLTQRHLNRLCTLTPSVAYRASFLAEEAYQVSANFKLMLSFLFVASATLAFSLRRRCRACRGGWGVAVADGVILNICFYFKLRMLRILHLITCYAGASPQGEAFYKSYIVPRLKQMSL